MKLKPCPFCGQAPIMEPFGKDGIQIRCPRCLVMFRQRVIRYPLKWLEEKMIESWNKRTPEVTNEQPNT